MKTTDVTSAILFFVIEFCTISVTNGQDKASTYDSLSLKDLLNVKIVSVSKKSESLFDAPLSATVVSKDDIKNAGCTSIMDALRLSPGLIVREQDNGNYDIYIRGMDNVPPNAPFDGNSTTTLVMIDSRPIYNYLKGGTFWETLPVDLNDIEKIEVIRGPAAALYGPNAVSGVINIITRRTSKNGIYLVANARQGSYQSYINNVSLGYQSKKWNVIASGNSQHRDRTQTSYFELYRNRYVDTPTYFIRLLSDTVYNVNEMYPDPSLAMQKYAGNLFFNYYPSDKTTITVSSGMQHSFVQKVSTDNGITPLTSVQSDSKYADLKINTNGLSSQFSINTGTQKSNFNPGNKYDFTTFDANIDYNYSRNRLLVKPAISYRTAIYDDTRYSDVVNKSGLFNARGTITTLSASVRGEYNFLYNKLRLITGIAASKFNYPDATYLSYELASTYKINKNHLIRTVFSRAPRSSTIYDAYIDQTISFYPTGDKKFTRYAVEGNKNLRLLTADMLEIGYRGKISSSFSIDVEAFNIRSKNYSNLVSSRPFVNLVGKDTIQTLPLIPTNLPLVLMQDGVTLSILYGANKIKVKAFVTLQRSRQKNYTQYLNTPDAPPSMIEPDPAKNNIYSGIGSVNNLKGTPTAFGGADFNYKVSENLSCDLSMYYYTNQTYYHATNTIFNDGIRGIDHIKAKVIINANINYEPVKGLHFTCAAKNITNDNSREFFKADAVPVMLFGGINYEF